MGGNFKQDSESTEGIATHLIKSAFNKKKLVKQTWYETSITIEERLEDFHKYIVSKSKLPLEDTDYIHPDTMSTVSRPESETSEDSEKCSGDQISLPPFSHVKERVTSWGRKIFKSRTSHILSSDDTGDTNRDILSSNESETGRDSKGSSQAQIFPPLFENVKDSEHSPTAEKTRDVLPQDQQTSNIDTTHCTTSNTAEKSRNDLPKYEPMSKIQATKTAIPKTTETPQIRHQMSEKEWEKLVLYQNQLSERSADDDIIPYTVSFWDLGGQDEFIPTHHFFLGAEDTTLLVMDISKNFEKTLNCDDKQNEKEGVPKTPKDILYYWLNSIHGLASAKGLKPNLGLVLTHKDEIPSKDTKLYIQQYKANILKVTERKPYSSFLSMENIYVVDNKYGKESDFGILRSDIFKMISKQKSWGMERPLRWLKLETDILEKAKDENLRYLHVSEIDHLASRYQMKDAEIKSFLQFYHIFGDFVYYPDHALCDIVIIEPQWLLNSFKALITAHEFLDKRQLPDYVLEQLKQGKVSEDGLKVLWGKYYPKVLEELMIKLNLILPLELEAEKKRYLIPCMLPSLQLNIYGKEPFKSMTFVYTALHQPLTGEQLEIGTYQKILGRCSKIPSWQICEDHLSYTDASFEIGNNCRLTLMMKNNVIRARIWSKKGTVGDNTKVLILNTRIALSDIVIPMKVIPSTIFQMLCPLHNRHDEEICTVDIEETIDTTTSKPNLCVVDERCLVNDHMLRKEELMEKVELSKYY